ncbi:MAG: 2,3-bisphosphoglycerate-independent phosphoglycerate mutase [Candidatus Kerfeldbacteria bacterium]|nr:2,3-bisphosphoglycerate-independent phosphoglycerate mutase [Candidatus Kerfeldbacteria bacterium]
MKPLVRTPLVLVILDGWGSAPAGPGNAITLANTPVFDELIRRYPHALLAAAGTDVGLPARQAGNSEAGHMNIGAGRLVEQDSVRISKSINDGSFFKNPAWRAAIHHVRKYRSQLHLMGLLSSDQSGHADPDHLLALLTLGRNMDVPAVRLHVFTDGRDSPPRSGINILRRLAAMLSDREKIATVVGRFYAMDRNKIWSRTKRAYEAMVAGKGRQAPTAAAAIDEAYTKGQTDEFIAPTVIGPRHQNRIRKNDSVIFFNLRSDRARQLTKAFVQKHFVKLNRGAFRRVNFPTNLLFVAMTDFGPDLGEIYTAFPSQDLRNTLPFLFHPLRQLYVGEGEKFAHVTFFFNGGYDHPVVGEDRQLIPSPGIHSYDRSPVMSAREIADYVVKDLAQGRHDVIVLNFANPDMLGHTGNLKATVQAIEVVDQCLGQIRRAVAERDGTMVITADHGNAESMLADDGKTVNTEHTNNPVPFVLVTNSPLNVKFRKGGRLADVAPTLLDLLGRPKSIMMTGISLVATSHGA